MSTGCCERFARGFLIAINIVFFLLGVCFVVAGALLRTQKISHEVLPALSTLEVCGHDVTNLIYTVSTLAIVTGVIVVCVSCVGMFGAGFEVKGMLITYVVCVILLLIVEMCAVVMGFKLRKKFDNKDELFECLQKYSSELVNGTSRISNAWNQAFLHFDCCAVDPVKGTKNDFDSTPWCTMSGSCYRSDAQIPRSCCTGVDETNYMTKASSECFLTVTSNYKTTGCFERLQQYLGYSQSVIGIGIVIMIAEITGVVFAVVLLCSKNRINMAV
uniref:Tetraspanin-9-like n=1 Tax=Crassostrea virginica TaxID=6565 RepID=A0A8B8DHK1_CRAVI|nr:tetraspanin-9-like [Crassostrea virginica]